MFSESPDQEVLDDSVSFDELPQLGSEASASHDKMAKEELLKSLGFVGVLVVGMSGTRDIYRAYDRWDTNSDAQKFWENPPKERLESIELTWHQVVGLHYGTASMVKREAFFLFDAVGIGKTAQSAAVVLMRPWLIMYEKSHKKLPPALGEFFHLKACFHRLSAYLVLTTNYRGDQWSSDTVGWYHGYYCGTITSEAMGTGNPRFCHQGANRHSRVRAFQRRSTPVVEYALQELFPASRVPEGIPCLT